MNDKRIRSVVFVALAVLAAELCYVSIAMADEPPAKVASVEERSAFAHKFAQTVLAIIQHPKESYAARKELLRDAFAKSVDIAWIGRFVLGSTWNTASDEQKEEYMALYRRYLTETYVANFAEKPEKRIRDIRINSVTQTEAPEDFNVRTQMMLASMENLQVNYLVNECEGKYRVRDIAIENVSLISTHRSEFREIAASGGVERVISELKERLGDQPRPITLSMK